MNEFNNQNVNQGQNEAAETNTQSPTAQVQCATTQNTQSQAQNTAPADNIYARENANQNAAFAQSAEFHRETPYGSMQNTQQNPYTAQQNAYTGTQNPQNAQNQQQAHAGFNPYTGQPYGQMNTAEPEKDKAKKKAKKPVSGIIKKLAATVALALVFGVVSGAVILGMTGGRTSKGGNGGNDSGIVSGTVGGDSVLGGSATGELRSASAIMEEALKAAEISAGDTLTIPQINIIMEPAMVSINCYAETTYNTWYGTQVYPTSSAGSGIIVGENETELLIVTNNHVVDGADEITVVFTDESEYTAYIKGTDSTNDLAIIVVKLEDVTNETMSAIAYAELGDSDALVVGEGVVAIGNALGYGQSVTAGIVSALNRAVTDSNGNTTYLIQTDAAVNPGNSGGALVNMKGQVIGINSAKYSDESVEGMCFAIPVNTALPILEELMTRTTRVAVDDPDKAAYLGITPRDVSSSMAAYNMPIGVFVSDVAEGSAAANAGMLSGDIITKFDHETVTSSSDLQKILSYYEAGETVEVVVQRYERGQYNETTLTVTLDVRPADTAASGDADTSGQEDEDTAPSWKDYFGSGR